MIKYILKTNDPPDPIFFNRIHYQEKIRKRQT